MEEIFSKLDFKDTRNNDLYKDYWNAPKEECVGGLIPTDDVKNNKFWTNEQWWMQSDLLWRYMNNCKDFFKNKAILINESSIIDMGCGKGHPLFKFSNDWGFKKIIGIEITKEYYDICLKNLNIIKETSPEFLKTEIEVLNKNAIDCNIEKDVCFIYMYNPFGPKTMLTVVQNINKSLKENPREFYIIYKNAIHRNILIANNFEIVYSEDNEKFCILKYNN